MAHRALFAGLVYDEREIPLETVYIGSEAFYVVNDSGFLRHVEADEIDRYVITIFLQHLEENKDMAVEQALRLIGKDDLFTKAAVDASMRNIDLDKIIKQGLPEQARNMMGMLGFRIIINHHGEIVRIDQPTAPDNFD